MAGPRREALGAGQLLRWVLLQAAWAAGGGQLHYSVPEEAEPGTLVGRLAQDVGLEVAELVSRRLRAVAKGGRDCFEVNAQSGALLVKSRLDREELCGPSPRCALDLEVLVDKPLRLFPVEVEIRDINDNAPSFPLAEKNLFILESRLPGSRFPLEGASDADIGTNSLLSYTLSPNEHFSLDLQRNDGHTESLVLVLKKPLDREQTPEHRLLLTATDGGKPELMGTAQLVISVRDVNDNAPVFNQPVYKIQLLENAANGTLVIKLNATDIDEGSNKEIIYSIRSLGTPRERAAFRLSPETGEISVNRELDFEDINLYEIWVQATDKGNPPLAGHCKVLVEVLDVNDHAPELAVTSLSLPVPEDAPPGTVVALLSVSDRDSGDNGKVSCSIGPGLPFRLVSTFKNYHSLVVAEALDRERVAEYEVVVRARDQGAPPLWASRRLVVPLSDVNDNAPAFPQAVYTVFVRENNPAGAPVLSVSAWDPDLGANGRVSYWAVERRVGERPLSSYISVHSESGQVSALQPLDYEELQVLQFEVSARDAGLPALCGNVSVQLFVLDANDNAPVVSPPGSGRGALGPELVPLSAGAGHVVGKVRAVDADSGYNAWLRYELQEPRAAGPFRVGVYSGEISTARALEEADGPSRSLVIVVRDHGEPALSATATVSLSLSERAQAVAWESGPPRAGSAGPAGAMNVSLMIAICSVSGLFVLVIVLYVGLRCPGAPEVTCGPGKGPGASASEAGSWSYSQRQSRLVCVGEGTVRSDLMVFSPVCPQSSENGEAGNGKVLTTNASGMPKQPNPDWRYSASLRAGIQSAVHMEEAGVLRGGPGGPEQLWPTVSSATPEPEAGEVSPPVGAGVNSNSWTFKYGPGNPKQAGPGELPDKFIIPGSPAIISIRQEPPNSQIDKSDFITFGKKEETKKKKKKKKGNKTQEKKEKGNSTTDNSDQ
uniref:Protocadherin alpha-8 n=1 Tax=Pelodiscus sinensis TaxID=13735 RepID=K7F7L3_PELSI|nr:protocadherin alpha-3 isoform X3 [Pelodiscus sinensis]|eukprot:XP_006135158.1 protocadherin alpha-3 isoform X3 [Pelodiscus sinensis]